MSKAILLVHAGAGINIKDFDEAKTTKSKEGLSTALQAGYSILKNGDSALDAVEAAVRALEDFPLFNAGKGAVLNSTGKCELHASIMDGQNKKAGTVAAITIAKNPISVARAIMEKTEYVGLIGTSADDFAKEQKFEIVDPSYFITQERLDKLKQAQLAASQTASNKMGTVGAVALDKNGNLAAATSTGGRNNTRYGRLSDSAIIGAGTYADNKTCAVSSTGHGEIFIRNIVAYDIAALIEYKKLSIEEACDLVINTKLAKDTGGVIALDKQGNYAMPFNTEGMLRGYITFDGLYKTDLH